MCMKNDEVKKDSGCEPYIECKKKEVIWRSSEQAEQEIAVHRATL